MTNDEFRDQAALMAMQGLCAKYGKEDVHSVEAYNQAEALLAERTKRYGKPDDGWIKWNGGECPVDPDTVVEVEFRAIRGDKECAKFFDWKHYGTNDDIIAYRVVGGAQS